MAGAVFGALAVLLLVLLVLLALTVQGIKTSHGRTTRARMLGGAPTAPELFPAEPCLPRAMLQSATRALKTTPFECPHGPATALEVVALAALAERLSKAHGVALTAGDLLGYRHKLIMLEQMYHFPDVGRQKTAIAEALARGERVLDVANRLKLPPTAVLRQALYSRGWGKERTKRAIADPKSTPADLRGQLVEISAADFGARAHMMQTGDHAKRYEEVVGSYLEAHGVAFMTEDDLRRVQAPGEPTPDFLLNPPLQLRGHTLHWLDAKNYASTDDPLTFKSNRAQAAKYTAKFGPGAFVFSRGVMCGSKLAACAQLLSLRDD